MRNSKATGGSKLTKDRSVASDHIETGTEDTGHTNPTRQPGTPAEASA
jgi:hypothetical protein